jgi:hypothetical protein
MGGEQATRVVVNDFLFGIPTGPVSCRIALPKAVDFPDVVEAGEFGGLVGLTARNILEISICDVGGDALGNRFDADVTAPLTLPALGVAIIRQA